jgi:hypothetical protein
MVRVNRKDSKLEQLFKMRQGVKDRPSLQQTNDKRADSVRAQKKAACSQIKVQRIESQNHNRETKHYVKFQESIKRLQVQNALKDKLSKFRIQYQQKLTNEERDIKKMLRELKTLVSHLFTKNFP